MSESAATPSAHVVAREFVKQYYMMQSSAPQFLHRFYSHNSCFIHADDVHAVTGQAEIHKKIMSLNFNNCHSRICQVDSQSSVGDSVVIQGYQLAKWLSPAAIGVMSGVTGCDFVARHTSDNVIGELSNADQPMRRFVQSFVLVPQSANKYYVHVDIFRYQDSMSLDNADEQEGLENGEAAEPLPTASEEGISMTIDGNEKELPDDLTNQQEACGDQQQQLEQNEPVNSALEANSASGINGLAEEITPEGAPAEIKTSGDKAEQDKVPSCEGPAAVPASADGKTAQSEEGVAEKASVEQPVAPSKPLSWAAMAKRNTGAMSQQSTTAASNTSARPPVATPDQKSSDAAVSVPPRTNRSVATSSEDRGNSCNGRSMTNGSREGVDAGRRGNVTTSLANVSDNQQIFVGNLPQHVTDQELIEFFEKFGSVLDFKISRKPGTSPANNNIGQKNFGFMAFESADTVKKVLDARPIYMGKLRLNIEEKKAKEEIARERSAFQSHGSGGRPQPESGTAFVRSSNGVRRGGGRDVRSDTRASASEESRLN